MIICQVKLGFGRSDRKCEKNKIRPCAAFFMGLANVGVKVREVCTPIESPKTEICDFDCRLRWCLLRVRGLNDFLRKQE